MVHQQDTSQPKPNLSVISEACLQDLDCLYMDAAAKLREYDELCIEKEKIILEFHKLEQAKSCGLNMQGARTVTRTGRLAKSY